jgi:hypothetical protein
MVGLNYLFLLDLKPFLVCISDCTASDDRMIRPRIGQDEEKSQTHLGQFSRSSSGGLNPETPHTKQE